MLWQLDASGLAEAYRRGDATPELDRIEDVHEGEAAGLNRSAGLAQALDEGDDLADEQVLSGRALSSDSMAAYWAAQVSEGGDSHYGYGWSIVEATEGTLVTHDGSNGIHFAEATLVPAKELVIFLQTNVRAELPMVGQIVDQITARFLSETPLPTLPKLSSASGADLEAWVGNYDLEGGGNLQVTLEEGALNVSSTDRKGFAVLRSTRPVDFSRTERLSSRIDSLVGAYVEGDYKPLWEAYGRSTSLERLEERWDGRMRELEASVAGGLPNHAFHVFCVYPWVGMLKAGSGGPALEVIAVFTPRSSICTSDG